MLKLITDRQLEIKDLYTDFKDGVLLSFLIQAASGTFLVKIQIFRKRVSFATVHPPFSLSPSPFLHFPALSFWDTPILPPPYPTRPHFSPIFAPPPCSALPSRSNRFFLSTGVPNIKRNEPAAGKELLKQKAIENLNAAIQVATDDGVRLTNIGANDLYEGNEKLINGVRAESPDADL